MTLSGHTDISPNHLCSSLHCRCNLTSVTSAKQCWNPRSGPPKGLNELPEVRFAFPFILIGKWVMAFSTGQSWPRISALFHRQTSPDLSFVCGTGNQYMQNNIISDKLFNMKYCLFSQHYSHITEELPVPRCPLLHGCKLTGSGVWKLLWWVPWRVVPLVHVGPGSLGSLAFQRLQKEW